MFQTRLDLIIWIYGVSVCSHYENYSIGIDKNDLYEK